MKLRRPDSVKQRVYGLSVRLLLPLLTCLLLFITPVQLFAQESRHSSKEVNEPVVVTVGVFVQDVYDIDLKTGQFSALFYLWFRYSGDFEPSGFQLMNGVILEKLPPDRFEIRPGASYYSVPIRARLSSRLNFHRFPFESVTLPIVIEDDSEDVEVVKYLPDMKDSAMAPDIRIPGYAFPKGRFSVGTYHYNSDFGEQTGRTGESFSRATFVVEAQNFPPE